MVDRDRDRIRHLRLEHRNRSLVVVRIGVSHIRAIHIEVRHTRAGRIAIQDIAAGEDMLRIMVVEVDHNLRHHIRAVAEGIHQIGVHRIEVVAGGILRIEALQTTAAVEEGSFQIRELSTVAEVGNLQTMEPNTVVVEVGNLRSFAVLEHVRLGLFTIGFEQMPTEL